MAEDFKYFKKYKQYRNMAIISIFLLVVLGTVFGFSAFSKSKTCLLSYQDLESSGPIQESSNADATFFQGGTTGGLNLSSSALEILKSNLEEYYQSENINASTGDLTGRRGMIDPTTFLDANGDVDTIAISEFKNNMPFGEIGDKFLSRFETILDEGVENGEITSYQANEILEELIK